VQWIEGAVYFRRPRFPRLDCERDWRRLRPSRLANNRRIVFVRDELCLPRAPFLPTDRHQNNSSQPSRSAIIPPRR